MGVKLKDFRWSFSQWETYEQCPAKWNYQSVLRIPRAPPGPAAARGLLIHQSVDDYISNVPGTKLHPAVSEKYIPVLNEFRDHPNGERHTELKVSFNEDWSLTGGFGTDKPWCVMVLDAVRVGGAWAGKDKFPPQNRTAYVGEWKSGKPKDSHPDQRKLYALGAMIKWPHADEVHVTTYYLEDTGPPQRLVVKRTAEEKLKELWRGRVEFMQKDKFLAPKPSFGCRWCDYSKQKGGPCQF